MFTKKYIDKRKIKLFVKITDPIDPAKVLFGLIFVNFGPLNEFYQIDILQCLMLYILKNNKKIISNLIKFEKNTKNKHKYKNINYKKEFDIKNKNFFF